MFTSCRLCLAEDANLSIFNELNINEVPMRIMTCTGLEIQHNDELPQLICSICRLRLEEFYFFRKRCLATDRRLRQHRRLIKLGQPSDIESEVTGDDDDASVHLETTRCTPTACSESGSRWRSEAAQLIRNEMDSYKKQLLAICKQQVREEIEQQVRSEIEEVVIAEARKQCRLNVLDDLFHEIERFFIRKRNEDAYCHTYISEGIGSDSDTVDLESVTTLVDPEGTGYGMNESEIVESAPVIDLLDDETVPTAVTVDTEQSNTSHLNTVPVNAASKRTEININKVDAPMVEINMRGNHLNHLHDEISETSFLSSLSNKGSKKKWNAARSNYSLSKRQEHVMVCRRHSKIFEKPTVRRKRRIDLIFNEDDCKNCVRCRLRGGQVTTPNKQHK